MARELSNNCNSPGQHTIKQLANEQDGNAIPPLWQRYQHVQKGHDDTGPNPGYT